MTDTKVHIAPQTGSTPAVVELNFSDVLRLCSSHRQDSLAHVTKTAGENNIVSTITPSFTVTRCLFVVVVVCEEFNPDLKTGLTV